MPGIICNNSPPLFFKQCLSVSLEITNLGIQTIQQAPRILLALAWHASLSLAFQLVFRTQVLIRASTLLTELSLLGPHIFKRKKNTNEINF